MTFGHVRDGFPYLSIRLPGLAGILDVECVLDTGFDGELILPLQVVRRVDCEYVGERRAALADRTIRWAPGFSIHAEWLDEERVIEAIVLDGRPLIGGRLLEGNLIQIEMQTGGEVVVGPL